MLAATPMFAIFDFDLPRGVTEQLKEKLATVVVSPLDQAALTDLLQFQSRAALADPRYSQSAQGITQGIYLLHYDGPVVYVGKAGDVRERLSQHLRKLNGRSGRPGGMDMAKVGYRCLLLHRNWTTSANEELLIEEYKANGQCQWNGTGFGPKDVGRNRDGNEPGWFDQTYPINDAFPCQGILDAETVGGLLAKLKERLPFLLRYKVPSAEAATAVNLTGVPREAAALVRAAAAALGAGWRATEFHSHMILYRETKVYDHFVRVLYP